MIRCLQNTRIPSLKYTKMCQHIKHNIFLLPPAIRKSFDDDLENLATFHRNALHLELANPGSSGREIARRGAQGHPLGAHKSEEQGEVTLVA